MPIIIDLGWICGSGSGRFGKTRGTGCQEGDCCCYENMEEKYKYESNFAGFGVVAVAMVVVVGDEVRATILFSRPQVSKKKKK